MMVYLSCSFLKKMMKTIQIPSNVGVIGLEKGCVLIQDARLGDLLNVSYRSGKKTNIQDIKKASGCKETTCIERKRVVREHNPDEGELLQIIMSLYQTLLLARNVGITGSMIDSRFPILFNSFLIPSISLNVCNEDNLVSPHVILSRRRTHL
ncbi:hypothetical protein RCC94_15275 [Exiguobacterium acetylicum]|uniref:hypothetical protein n=1 Tax=Exiguobacterium acetylicum TaxID=41170 RepID=UPI0027E1F613|nr:hypothetical protein [Exiguobacterium acetylicum]MDQ6468859.1 hypothetical protein [Exiguobacterium acetylicum]